PMTHDLMKTLVERCGAKIDRVEVHDVRNNTFFAMIYLRQPCGEILAIDARPSDALALALRTRAVIRVAKKVIDKVRRIDLRRADARMRAPMDEEHFPEPEIECCRELLERLGDHVFGKWKM
ncbi:MAG: bifunctional nuclease family protein, partial [Deltaproteobacteria bacterium]|nr:bifunctional nuclease family protein [Deltaproteobacteria bacterium]